MKLPKGTFKSVRRVAKRFFDYAQNDDYIHSVDYAQNDKDIATFC